MCRGVSFGIGGSGGRGTGGGGEATSSSTVSGATEDLEYEWMLAGFGLCSGESDVYVEIGENEAPVYGESSFSCDGSYWDSIFRNKGIHCGSLMSLPLSICWYEFRDVGSSTGEATVAILFCRNGGAGRDSWYRTCHEADATKKASRAHIDTISGKIRLARIGHRLWSRAGAGHVCCLRHRGHYWRAGQAGLEKGKSRALEG